MAQFYISGIWQPNARITEVMLHPALQGGGVGRGTRTSEQAVINRINQRDVVHTITWNYTTREWNLGAQVTVVQEYGRNILRTVPNATVKDNLDNMIRMENFF